MTDKQWPQIRGSRLGKGVFVEADVLYALRVADDPAHARVTARLLELAADGLPLAVSYLSLTEAALRVHRGYGSEAASALVKEAREVMNVILPDDDETKEAERILAEGADHFTLEQAVTGAMAKKYGCAVYGFTPAYHLLRIPVVI